jgi:hypothetical protein
MTRPTRPNERAVRNGHAWVDQTATLITLALECIAAELEQHAAYVGGGDNSRPRVSGAGRTVWVPEDEHGPGEHVPVTSVEAAVMRSSLIRDHREEIRDRLDGLIMGRESFERWLRGLIPAELLKVVPELCDGKAKGYDGHQLVWVPSSRDPRNGWHNPACREIANALGVCDTCRRRMNHWRTRNGLQALGVQDREVAA